MTGKKITERIKDPEQTSSEMTTGIPIDGTVDPTGEYPRRYNWYGNSISQAGRGVKINSLSMGGSTLGVNFDVPMNNPSMFPYNQANETPSGHSFELDDTPGSERILIKHHSGAGVELKSDGSVVVAAKSHRIEVVGADHNVVVQGQGNITYDGDLNMIVNGNYNLTVNGTYNVDVGANHNHSVHGTQITEVGDVHQTIVRGNKDTKVYGDVLDLSIGERKVVGKKDIKVITGRDHIINSARHVRSTAEELVTASSGKGMTLVSEKVNITGRYGKVGGEHFHHVGSLFTGPGDTDAKGDQGTKTVFHGNLIGRALESWTSKYSLYAREAHSAHISNFATVAKVADKAKDASRASFATTALGATTWMPPVTIPIPMPDLYPDWEDGETYEGSTSDIAGADKPDYKFKWGWNVEEFTAYEQQTNFLANGAPDTMQGVDGPTKISPYYTPNEDWFEVWNKTSPFAVRKVYVDFDGSLEEKISKIDGYTYYFRWSPSTDEVRAKLRTMDGANDTATSPEKQTDGEKCIQTLLDENRISPHYKNGGPSSPYEMKRKGKQQPYKDGSRFGKTLLGNPVERASKVVKPKNQKAKNRTILADPVYNPDKHDKPITSSTKLSKSCTVAKFLGAPGSRSSLEMIPLLEDRQNLARQWYLHAWLMEGVASSREFKDYRLQVTEGYYHPAKGIREEGDGNTDYWREPFKKEDGTSAQPSIVKGSYEINELKHNGRAVVYTLYNSRGKTDYSAMFDLSLYIRDTFFYDQLSLDYDMTRPDFVMSQQLIVVMPEIEKDFKANFEMKTCTYFNRQMLDGSDLIEISD